MSITPGPKFVKRLLGIIEIIEIIETIEIVIDKR